MGDVLFIRLFRSECTEAGILSHKFRGGERESAQKKGRMTYGEPRKGRKAESL